MSESSSSGEEDYDPTRYAQLNDDLSMPGVEKRMINVLVTGFGPFASHSVNASWHAVTELAKLGVAHNVNLVTLEIPVEYKTVQKLIPELWAKYKPHLVVHVGVSGQSTEIAFETIAHNNGYKQYDVSGHSAPSQCFNPEKGDDSLQTGIDINKLCEDVNNSGCLAMVSSSTEAGRYLCEYIFYASLCQDSSRVAFIHVPPLDQPYTAAELGHALQCSIQCMLKQLDLYHPLTLPDEHVLEELKKQHERSVDGASD